MGGPMASSKSLQNNYRCSGAIVEGPGGNVFIKFTGPAKTNCGQPIRVRAITEFIR